MRRATAQAPGWRRSEMPTERRHGRFLNKPGTGEVGWRTAFALAAVSIRKGVASLLGLSSLFLPLAVMTLAGCHPFPVHYDPLSVNGRDGGGAPPSYEALMRIGAAALAGGDPVNALGVFRRAAEI